MSFEPMWAPKNEIIMSQEKPGRVPRDLISICVTNFNYGRFLPECLDSLAAQTHKALDLVIVDDCSTRDDSIGIASAWLKENARRFHRATLLSHVRNQGPSEARNTAFRHALSNSVFVIDADNIAYPRLIARLHAVMRGSTFQGAYTQMELFGDRTGIGSADIWDPTEIAINNYVDVMGLVLKSAWAKVGGYSHIDRGWEDYDFWLKFVDAGLELAYVPEILSRYRVHGKSRTASQALAAHHDLELLMAFRHP